MQEFTLPNLGENVENGDVLRVLVKPGDRVKKDQPVLELETDKAPSKSLRPSKALSKRSRSRQATR
jgi:pyruvate/2-oxoglutarate dehydrogenase complex dihydrolipoamide acyltransferase (E2) component